MTNNEAISKIRFMLDVGGSDGFTSTDIEALNMAINALSTEIIKTPKSNGDRIRQMTDEELAEMLDYDCMEDTCDYCAREDDMNCGKGDVCKNGILEWLRKEVDEDAGTDD